MGSAASALAWATASGRLAGRFLTALSRALELAKESGAAAVLTDVWVAVRANLRAVLEKVTLADLAAGKLPLSVKRLTEDPDTWEPH